MNRLIAFAGYARAGKTTAAQWLVDNHGYTRMSFADPLREMLLGLDPWVCNSHDGSPQRLSVLIAMYGWNGVKTNFMGSQYFKEVRRLLQHVGTDIVRKANPDYWVDQMLCQIEVAGKPVVIDDLRFDNEADLIKCAGGQIILITNPRVFGGDHVSEELAGMFGNRFDVVTNGGSIEDFHHLLQRHFELTDAAK